MILCDGHTVSISSHDLYTKDLSAVCRVFVFADEISKRFGDLSDGEMNETYLKVLNAYFISVYIFFSEILSNTY